MLEAVLFDCWGTLVKAPGLTSRGSTSKTLHNILSSRGLRIEDESFREAYSEVARRQNEEARADWRELDHVERLRQTLRMAGFESPRFETIVQNVWAVYLLEWPRQSTLYDGAMTLLNELRGRFRLGLVTNYPDGPTAREVFRKFGLESIFDSLVVSGEVGYRKPRRIIFDRALSELGVTPDVTVMVGDTFLADVVGPKEIGMMAVLIDEDGSRTDNYDLPDAVVSGISGVKEALEGLE
jgi:putative hydrolase of the HAD superfamily